MRGPHEVACPISPSRAEGVAFFFLAPYSPHTHTSASPHFRHFLGQILEAMGVMEDAGIIHCDLKVSRRA